MATLKELNYNIRNLIRGGILSDDERIAERQMDFIINYVRGLFVKQSLNKGEAVDPSLNQTICLEFELVDPSCCPDVPTDCPILRTTLKVPQVLRSKSGLAITEVAAPDGSMSYPVISQSRARWSKHNKYTSLNKKVFFKDNYLYMINDVYQERACMTAIFANPVLANASSCTPTTDEYPIPIDMIDGITNHIIRNIVMLSLMVNTDELNDSNGRVINSFRSSRNDSKENPQDT